MDWMIWIKGLALGFSIAAPVGPIGVLCIRRTLADGRLRGFVSGLGAATADAVYGWIAAVGLTVVSGFLVNHQTGFRIVGGAFLVYLGARTLSSRTAPLQPLGTVSTPGADTRGFLGSYLSTFLLTLSNPATILSFVAIFAGLGVTAGGGIGQAISLVVGVFCGSALWWLTLSLVVGAFRARINPSGMVWVNRAAGACILAFGLLAVISGIARGAA